MRCPACGAPVDRAHGSCPICGRLAHSKGDKGWSREPEAAAYQDLQPALEADEQLLGLTRGRVAGSWRQRAVAGPQAMLSPYANLGLTGRRLLLQAVNALTGKALPGKAASLPTEEVVDLSAAAALGGPDGEEVRLVVQLRSGALKMRAAGRNAVLAQEMSEVWRSLAADRQPPETPRRLCPHCGLDVGDPSRFCPFCGKELKI